MRDVLHTRTERGRQICMTFGLKNVDYRHMTGRQRSWRALAARNAERAAARRRGKSQGIEGFREQP